MQVGWEKGPTQLSISALGFRGKAASEREIAGRLSHPIRRTIRSNSASHCWEESKAIPPGSLLCADLSGQLLAEPSSSPVGSLYPNSAD